VGALAGKTALVTGGSRGIGRAIVERFVSEGAAVAFGYRSGARQADEVVRRAGEAAVRLRAIQADVTDLRQIEQLFDSAEAFLGGLDIVVNNAGVGGGRNTPIADTTEDEYERITSVNAKGTFFCLREASRRVRDGGRIINVSSTVTGSGLYGTAVYSASKAAVERFTATAAKELGTRGIAVNTLSPGAVDTDLFRAANDPDVVPQIAAMAAFGRIGEPHDIAAAALFLAGPDSGWLTGQNLRVDGGL